MESLSRGSEWRKWDLHFHTPASYDYQNKSVTNQQLVDKLAESNISAVAITDHHTIDVLKIQELQRLGKEKNITVFAGIEFCSELGGKESIHFIGIFPENSDISSIWTTLQGKLGITVADIAQKGGLENIVCDLIDTCDIIHELGGITTIHAGSKTNTLENITNNLVVKMQQKQRILSNCIDILELGKIDDIKSYKQIIFKNIGFIMPMILCSDNHNINEYALKQNCWIKSDTTFEGLKQILFEPEERVKIQESKPEEKSVYQVIDSVILNEDDFWNEKIYFNENLNTVIGGRSTGKSTLLKAIAKKIYSKIESNDEFVNSHLIGVSVKWKDGEETASRDIDFFPQNYMYEIAKNEEETNKLIQDIIRNRDENKILEEYKIQNETLKKNIAKNILEIFQNQSDIENLQDQLKKKGDKKGVETEITRLSSKISDLNKNSQTSQEELETYKKLLKDISDSELIISQAENDLKLFERMKIATPINNSYPAENGFDNLSYSLNNYELIRYFKNLTIKTEKEWLEIVEQFEKSTNEGKVQHNSKIDEIKKNNVFVRVTKYYNDNKELNDVQSKLKEENNKLQEITKLEKQITNLNTQKNNTLQSIIDDHLTYKSNTQNVVDNLSVEFDGIKITLKMNFQKQNLRNFLESKLNRRGNDRQDFMETFINQYETNTSAQCKVFLSKALNKEIDYKNYNTNENVVNELLIKNWFDISYELSYQNDTFSEMSEGKQAFVILKLLLDFSTKKCPILIDQPEDSLDNRAIYNELVQYLKTKKKERQIIIVTHNPNVVVSADAENVIVANQNGNNSLNKNNIKFQYINGALEDTKSLNKNIAITLESQGIREHVCEILEGGKEAFEKRERKYGFKKLKN
jgi:predicted ATPase